MPYIMKMKEIDFLRNTHRIIVHLAVGFDPCGFQFQLTRNRGVWGTHEFKFKLTFLIFHIGLDWLE